MKTNQKDNGRRGRSLHISGNVLLLPEWSPCRGNRENCLYDPGWNILYFCLGGRSGDIMVCEMASQTEQRTGKYDKDFA